ncbi:MAG: RNA 2',3'-cyclic phosphodiesterase [Planctomycetota bacterium]|nr:MAG: RNA 2',3'-cyclic phosphodiesterase [Planctomycetota bacterium]
MSNVVRTFIAVEIPGEIKQRAARMIGELRAAPAKVKWVEPAHMHWTLKFLGNIDMLEIPAVCDAVKEAVEPLACFDVEAKGAGAFPDPRRPRTVWVGMGEGSEKMVELHDAVEFELAKLGYRSENRRFRPHLTIGRVRQSPAGIPELGRLIQEHADFEGGVSLVDEVVVFSSVLGRDGPTYDPLCHVELKGH